jgi:VanZ family protein
MTAKIVFRWAAWLLVLAIAVFTLSPIGLRPVTKAPADVERFLAFAAVGAAFCLGYPKHRLSILILLIGIIGGLEFAQNYVPSRHGRFPDGLAKVLGALMGTAFSLLVERYRRIT